MKRARTCSKDTPFCRLQNKAAKSGARNPAAVAAAAGFKKYGKAGMEAKAAAGRRKG